MTRQEEGESRFFPPEVAMHLVEMACRRPDWQGRSLSQWDCQELADQLRREAIVQSISAQSVRRILASHKLKPWRHHMWLSSEGPRDAAFYGAVREIIDLYLRPLEPFEMVLSVDEKTSLQPRLRKVSTKPAREGGGPNLVEHEYKRSGALQLFAGFDTRTGRVWGRCFERKRQVEFIAFLESLEADIPENITAIHLVCDNVSVHHGKLVRQWLEKYPRFVLHFTPVHCSWMNQIEQWFSILQRKRLRIADFASKEDLKAKLMQSIDQWNERAHPFNWSTKSVAKIMAEAPQELAA